MFEGYTPEQAQMKLDKYYLQKKRTKEIILNIYNKTIGLFIVIPIVWIGTKIVVLFQTIYLFYKMKNEKCPFISPQRKLR